MDNRLSHKPTVLFIMHLPPPIHGAAVVGTYIKSSPLINSKFMTAFANLATNIDLEQSGKGSLKKIFLFFSILRAIVKIQHQNRFDLCYLTLTASGLGFYKDFLIVLLLKLYRNRIIYHFHNKGVTQASKKGINRLLYSFVFRHTKSILLSSSLYADINAYVSEENVFYCPNGIPVIPTKARQAPDENLSPCKLLFLSNMIVEKGVFVLLEAVKELIRRGLAFECHYVGAWADMTENEFRAAITGYDLENVVFAHGPRFGGEKTALFTDADVFVFPTFYHYEVFPLVILEAMQYGLPVVSTLEGGIADIVLDGETGFLVPQQNAPKLADKLEVLIRDPAWRARMGNAGKRRFETHFTLDQFERRLADIIEHAIQEH